MMMILTDSMRMRSPNCSSWSVNQICQANSMMTGRQKLLRVVLMLVLLVLYCEWLHYYAVLIQCTWPRQHTASAQLNPDASDLKVMFLADTHLLGFRQGHWFDKLRREWQMKRAFQTSMMLHHPDVVFVLGDLLDEGKWCDDEEFQYHVERFNSMFQVPSNTQRHVIVGNHDIGFHYMISQHKLMRFQDAFGSSSVAILLVRGVVFVLLNSMAMEGDGCQLCQDAERDLKKISAELNCAKQTAEKEYTNKDCTTQPAFKYSRPILLQHFPLYRPSDANCSTPDAAPAAEKDAPFKQKHDTLSQEATDMLLKLLKPRLVVDGHIHHGCYVLHNKEIPEWTVASFSWRNKNNPSFVLARISETDHAVHLCQMPDERTVVAMYIVGVVVILLFLCCPLNRNKLGKTS